MRNIKQSPAYQDYLASVLRHQREASATVVKRPATPDIRQAISNTSFSHQLDVWQERLRFWEPLLVPEPGTFQEPFQPLKLQFQVHAL
ncbi:hypothetical protein WJX73_009612 [Symbiochloris irregularis]|uniref:Histone RNA hairpin-binding protein RNA-binding domain-containing protein n=1 Tax=Symbiochloris irregularis TaxID=706552 RepID=A0AAW1PTV8_9CHLO